MPYQTPPTIIPARKTVGVTSEQDDQVAAITATLATHMRKRTDEFRIVNIQSH